MHPELILFIVGKGSAEGDLRRLARSLGIGSSVTFTGRIEHSRSAFSAGDIFCVPRTIPFFREEPIQALADGLLLVIANDTIFDGLEHRRNAILVPPGEVDALAESISTALSDREGARQIAAAGQLHIRMNHTISGMVGRYQKIYERLAAPKRTFQIGSN